MTKFSEFFHVNQKNYFDVTLENDQTYFVDPVQIKGAKIENFNSTDAEASIKSFMNTAYDVVADRKSPETQNLLAPPHEINETRLGLTKRGSKGRGTSASILINVFSRIRGVPELKKVYCLILKCFLCLHRALDQIGFLISLQILFLINLLILPA